jgi:hypothetical protein
MWSFGTGSKLLFDLYLKEQANIKDYFYSRKWLTTTEIKKRISNKYSTLFAAFISTVEKLRSSCKSAVFPSAAAQ